ncbi:MAG: alanine--tRNA ligase, partial [Candidatus Sericytochromatia bacterium]|nr:alanine--tRNA ligase [Candidatus Tanganyikabacteria bacterium]
MQGAAIRERFSAFFKARGHLLVPSAPLVAEDDTGVLLTTAGMLPFKKVFMGLQAPPHPRVVSIQKCFRTSDLDQVGLTVRHHTFFEMLGCFAFASYFKPEIIGWAWEFLTRELGIPPERLWVSVHEDDGEALELWRHQGVPAERAIRLWGDESFWDSGATGPCGPCSEIWFDRGPEAGCGKAECGLRCGCDRFVELWNLVFMQFDRDEQGALSSLPDRNIDTGMGLERLAMVLQGVSSTFETDLLRPLVDHAAALSGIAYGTRDRSDVSLRVLADHGRAAALLLADGVVPGNEGRGYVLRRVIRRSIRHGRLLGLTEPFLADLASRAIALYAHYPELPANRDRVLEALGEEERRFHLILAQGMQRFAQALHEHRGAKTLPGEVAFELLDTHGFPLDLTIELARDHGMTVDLVDVQRRLDEQRARARNAQRPPGLLDHVRLRTALATQYVGHATVREQVKVLEVFRAGDRWGVVTDRTPFHPEGGGQQADRGWLGVHRVEDVRTLGACIVHLLAAGEEPPPEGKTLAAQVDEERRAGLARHHTATHLLGHALRQVLGAHAQQAGSEIREDGLRFDFRFPRALTPDELRAVEDLMNREIWRDLPVSAAETTLAEARAARALELPGERYGDRVRVVEISGASRELCDGSHARTTGAVGTVALVRETGVAAGVRRIEAAAGPAALAHFRSLRTALDATAAVMKVAPSEVPARAGRLLERLRGEERLRGAAERLLGAYLQGATGPRDALVKILLDPLPPELLASLAGKLAAPGRAVVVAGVAGGRAAAIASV